MKTGKEILAKWLQDYYALKAESPYRGGTIVPTWFSEPAHIGLEGLIDEALREARQEGLDHKKQHKLLRDEGEHGAYWKEFYLRGCLDLPGVAEAFNCQRDESIWRDQWQEVIRVHFKKATLRSVDPDDAFHEIWAEMKIETRQEWKIKHESIINELAGIAAIRELVPTGDGKYRSPEEVM